ncbi:arf-GAP with dual PH domain-containing protein 1-like isoform X1 [Chironomus tepperi]|uniref:arf-GAP with dual PH domain-containing protein 1-like isoform X1 n=2 Tax=Chironomus tepperi TaxID=113505 RepID=UPI00391FAA06
MAHNQKLILELLKIEDNDECADCGRKEVEYASYNLGVFVCSTCSQIHRSLGSHISKIKHINLDYFEDSQLYNLMDIGNRKSKLEYEKRVPACYRIPRYNDPPILLEQFIRAKYERKEFSGTILPAYMSGKVETFLMKKGKEDNRYFPRKFVLNEADDTLRYYVKEDKNPKAILRVSELNVVFARQWKKDMVHKNTLQISYLSPTNSTRNLFVYHEDAEVIVNWYHSIRCSKLNYLQIAFPHANESDLVSILTRDFAKEGYLMKTGPKPEDKYRRRWFTLDNRKLMYSIDPLDGYAKGEIFIGYKMDGYSVRPGVAENYRDEGFSFSLFTPERIYTLSATSSHERDDWMNEIQKIIERQLSPSDISLCSRLIRKRNTMNFLPGR